MINSILFFSVIIYVIQNITGVYGDCSANATSANMTSGPITYIGCQESVSTASMNNATTSTKTIISFKGIRFAQPPIGPLRFQKPLPINNSGITVIPATDFGPPCIQILPVDGLRLPSEDCLTINIWTPSLNNSTGLPVMFFIYGGAFIMGSGSQQILDTVNVGTYGGELLALRNVVIVTFNYRLGIFGFFNGNTPDAPGNAGLWDQAMALNWTRQNIAAFGGDPNRITIFGESAGSISCSCLITSPVTRSWFQGVIMESGSAYVKAFNRDKDYVYNIGRKCASSPVAFPLGTCANNSTSTSDMLDCLREKPAAELLDAQTSALIWNADQPFPVSSLASFVPIYNDEFLPMSVNEAVASGNFSLDVNLLFGHQQMEGALFGIIGILKGVADRYNPLLPTAYCTKEIVAADIRNIFLDNSTFDGPPSINYTKEFNNTLLVGLNLTLPPILGISLQIPIISPNPNPIRASAVQAFSDYYFACPTVLFGSYISKYPLFTGKVYQYKMTHISSQSISKLSVWTEASHTDELPFVFGLPFQTIILGIGPNLLWSDDDRYLSTVFMDIWTHFATYSEPPTVNGNVWPPYSVKSDNSTNATYLELNANNSLLGKVYVDRYRGNDGNFPSVIQNCFGFWDPIMRAQF